MTKNGFIYICIPWPFPPVADNTKEQQKQWGFYSILLAMTRDTAEFEWHCWSNTAHPPPSSTTFVASSMPSPLLPHRVASIRQPHGNSRCQSELCHNHSPLIPIPLFLARSLASLISILLSFKDLFTSSIHPNLGLPLELLPQTFAFSTFFSSRSLSILST